MIRFTIEDLPDQKFSTILNGRRTTFRIRYNVTTDRWSFDLSIDDLPVLYGRRIVTGVDLLAPFDFGIGSIFALTVTPGAEPNRKQLPAGEVRLYHATQGEIDAAVSPQS